MCSNTFPVAEFNQRFCREKLYQKNNCTPGIDDGKQANNKIQVNVFGDKHLPDAIYKSFLG